MGAAGVALKCHLKGKSAHHLLTKCRKGDLVVKCHLKAKCAHPWHAERRKGDLVDRCHPSAKSGHPWHAERRKGDLVDRCHPSAMSGKCGFRNVVKAICSLGVTRPQGTAILGMRNVVKAISSIGVTRPQRAAILGWRNPALRKSARLCSAERAVAERAAGAAGAKAVQCGTVCKGVGGFTPIVFCWFWLYGNSAVNWA